MTALRRAAAIFEIARGPSYIWKASALASLRVVERLLLAAALFAATADLRHGIEIAALLGAIHLLRGLVATGLRTETEVRIDRLAAAAVLDADPLHPVGRAREDAFATLMMGTFDAIALAADLLPDGIADAIAAVLLIVFLVLRGSLAEVGAFAVAMVLAALLALLVRRDTVRRGLRSREAHLPVWQQLRSILGGRYELAACGRGDEAERVLSTRLDTWRAAEDRYRRVASIAGGLPVLAAWTAIALATIARVHGGFDLASLGQAALLAGVAPPLLGLLVTWHEATKAERGFGPLSALIHAADARRKSEATRTRIYEPTNGQKNIWIRASDLEFHYPGETRAALAPLSFTWDGPRLVAIAGANGAGKTTLLRLLLQLAQPTAGALSIDGEPLAMFAGKSWRRSIAYVAQAPYIDEDATVRDFVQLLAPAASDVALRSALERVDVLHRLASRAADPLSTRMRHLSAGQTQRVVLARALTQATRTDSTTRLVLFDEPDASLDAAGVTLLVSLLRELAATRLVVVVAHSPVLLAAADEVLTLARPGG